MECKYNLDKNTFEFVIDDSNIKYSAVNFFDESNIDFNRLMNETELNNFAKSAKLLKLSYIITCTKTNMNDYIRLVKDIFSKNGLELNKLLINRQTAFGCSFIKNKSFCVNGKGFVFPCNIFGISIGNVRIESLSEVLDNSEILQYYLEDEKCNKCSAKNLRKTQNYLYEKHKMTLPCQGSQLIPHSKGMNIVGDLISLGDRYAVVKTKMTSDSIFADEKTQQIDKLMLIELAAQSAAVMNGIQEGIGKKDKVFLAGIRKFEFYSDIFVGDNIKTEIYKYSRFENFGILKCNHIRNDKIISKGEIKIWQEL